MHSPLYHASSFYKNILKDGYFKMTSKHPHWKLMRAKPPTNDEVQRDYISGLCTTRNIRFARTWANIVFEFDRAELAERFEITPIQYFQQPDRRYGSRQVSQPRGTVGSDAMNEYEEFIQSKNGRPVNVNMYVKRIHISYQMIPYLDMDIRYLLATKWKNKVTYFGNPAAEFRPPHPPEDHNDHVKVYTAWSYNNSLDQQKLDQQKASAQIYWGLDAISMKSLYPYQIEVVDSNTQISKQAIDKAHKYFLNLSESYVAYEKQMKDALKQNKVKTYSTEKKSAKAHIWSLNTKYGKLKNAKY